MRLPAAKILSHDIDPESVEIFDERASLFNPFTVEDFTAFQADQRTAMEEKALSHGLLEEAQTQAETSVRALLSAALPEGYELADKTPAEILDNGNQTFALVSVKKTSPAQATKKRVKVTLKFTTPGDADRELIVDINDANATQVKFADIEAALYEKYDDVTVWDNTWYSDLEIADGYYNAIRSLAVARK